MHLEDVEHNQHIILHDIEWAVFHQPPNTKHYPFVTPMPARVLGIYPEHAPLLVLVMTLKSDAHHTIEPVRVSPAWMTLIEQDCTNVLRVYEVSRVAYLLKSMTPNQIDTALKWFRMHEIT